MSGKRLRPSGHQREIDARIKKQKLASVLSATPKISSCFSSASSSVVRDTDEQSHSQEGPRFIPEGSTSSLSDNAVTDLLFSSVSSTCPELHSRSSTSHPKDHSNSTPSCSAPQLDVSDVATSSSQSSRRRPDDEGFDSGLSNMSSDIAHWSHLNSAEIDHWVHKGAAACKNTKKLYPETESTDKAGHKRSLQCVHFSRRLPNGETVDRDWLVYSPSTKSVFCFYCVLFPPNQMSNAFIQGCRDWKNIKKLIEGHENSAIHSESAIKLLTRQKTVGTIDHAAMEALDERISYWEKVLRRCVSVITFLAERGLAFRGSNEVIGSSENGNYVGLLELIAEYDAFLAQHIQKYAQRGKGHTSYLSKTICEELIQHMAAYVIAQISDQLKRAKYYSVSTDSTPDISHVDQLTVILRYVCPDTHQPVERFVGFLPMESHKGVDLAQQLLDHLDALSVDIGLCRGQSYDNASNMSGKYSGMQQKIKESGAPLAHYVPCAAHSLNLIGKAAAECCTEAISFFGLLEKLYAFFSASTRRWNLLKGKLPKGAKMPRLLSGTRWSARADATQAVFEGKKAFLSTLDDISEDPAQKPDTRHEASSLSDALSLLETAIMLELWHELLQQFDSTSKSLQSQQILLHTAVSLLDGLSRTIQTAGKNFDHYEKEALEKTEVKAYKEEQRRRRRRKKLPDESAEPDALEEMTPRKRFEVSTFNVVIDKISVAINDRTDAYRYLADLFGFLTNFRSMSQDQILEKSAAFFKVYPCDIASNFPFEFAHFAQFCASQSAELGPDDLDNFYSPLNIYSLLISNSVYQNFPSTEIAFRIYLSLMVTNCSGERSFSLLKRIKNALRSTMGQERLSGLSLLCIESDLLRNIDFSLLVSEFARAKSRKVALPRKLFVDHL